MSKRGGANRLRRCAHPLSVSPSYPEPMSLTGIERLWAGRGRSGGLVGGSGYLWRRIRDTGRGGRGS
jgi:hypothetical protein